MHHPLWPSPASVRAALLLVGGAALTVSCRTAGSGVEAGAAGARLEERYDRRNDSTVFRVVPPVSGPGAHLLAGAVIEGREVKQPPRQMLLGIRWSGSEVRFMGCELARWRGDGNLLAEVEVSRDVQIGGGLGISEFLSGTVPFPRAQALSAAGTVTVDLCGVELAISPEELDLLRQLVRRVTPWAP